MNKGFYINVENLTNKEQLRLLSLIKSFSFNELPYNKQLTIQIEKELQKGNEENNGKNI